MKAKLMKAYLPSCVELVRLILRKDLEELCQSTKKKRRKLVQTPALRTTTTGTCDRHSTCADLCQRHPDFERNLCRRR